MHNLGGGILFRNVKSIQSLPLNQLLYSQILGNLPDDLGLEIRAELSQLVSFLQHADIDNMQRVWSHNGPGLTRPFMLLDQLDARGERITEILHDHELLSQTLVGKAIWATYGDDALKLPGLNKLARNAALILSGLIIGAQANIELSRHIPMVANPKQNAAGR